MFDFSEGARIDCSYRHIFFPDVNSLRVVDNEILARYHKAEEYTAVQSLPDSHGSRGYTLASAEVL